MKVKDIVAKTTFVVLVADEEGIVCDSVDYLGDYEKYKNTTVKSMYPFHARGGLYKEGIVCVIKDKSEKNDGQN